MRPTFIEELMAAGRGVFGILLGDKQAPAYFDFTQRGLVGSFIGFIIITAVNLYLPLFMGTGLARGEITEGALQIAIGYALQLGASIIALRQLKRLDGLLPYVIADNWGSFYVTLIYVAVTAAGVTGLPVMVIFAIAIITLEINNARIVLTLAPIQVAIFVVARLVGAALAFGVIALLFPVPPEQVAALSFG
jgi:hypothetical protein